MGFDTIGIWESSIPINMGGKYNQDSIVSNKSRKFAKLSLGEEFRNIADKY